MTFKERAKLGMEILSKQRQITLEIALAQRERIKKRRTEKKQEKET